jgi:hypothetical protein
MFSKQSFLKQITILMLSSLLMNMGCSSGSGELIADTDIADGPLDRNLAASLASLLIESLSNEEKQAILFMREEEKLARDAYELFYQLWNQSIFNNIAAAEQTHMDAMLLLVDRYQLEDPITTDEAGLFVNVELQSLYDSLIDSLMVGAEIEEVDLIDLEIRYLESDNQDIHLIYDSLMKGSRNHLRSFVSNLINQELVYIPKHLSQEEYDAIINSPMEAGG